MDFKTAKKMMIEDGVAIRLPEWTGFWRWQYNTIKMYCKDGEIIDIKETNDLNFTLDNICRDDWEIAYDAKYNNIPIYIGNYKTTECLKRADGSMCDIICINRDHKKEIEKMAKRDGIDLRNVYTIQEFLSFNSYELQTVSSKIIVDDLDMILNFIFRNREIRFMTSSKFFIREK